MTCPRLRETHAKAGAGPSLGDAGHVQLGPGIRLGARRAPLTPRPGVVGPSPSDGSPQPCSLQAQARSPPGSSPWAPPLSSAGLGRFRSGGLTCTSPGGSETFTDKAAK